MSYGRRSFAPDESIYGLIPEPVATSQRTSMHRSKYSPSIPPTASTFGAAATSTIDASNLSGNYESHLSAHSHTKLSSTFGSKITQIPDPHSYLRKHTNPELPQPTRHAYTDTRKPPIPFEASTCDARTTNGCNNIYTTGTGTGTGTGTATANSNTVGPPSTVSDTVTSTNRARRNFITENALSVIMSDARKLPSSSPNYLQKADYGRVPGYLDSVKKEMAAEREYIRSVVASAREEEQKDQPRLQLLSEEERVRLLTDLKLKWEGVNRAYQGITHIVTLDTMGKVRRKEEYETELAQLEKAIERLSKKHVFVQE